MGQKGKCKFQSRQIQPDQIGQKEADKEEALVLSEPGWGLGMHGAPITLTTQSLPLEGML